MEERIKNVIERMKADNIKFIRLQFVDLHGIPKNVSIPCKLENMADLFKDGILFDGSSIPGFVGIDSSDLVLKPDISTYSALSWRPEESASCRFICDIYKPNGEPFEGDPRGILKKALAKIKEEGYTYNIGPEPEFFIVDTDDDGYPIPHDDAGYFDVEPVDKGTDFRREITTNLQELGFEVEASHHEVGPGQNEIAFKFDDALKTADAVITFKQAIKAIVANMADFDGFDYRVTFMPKPFFGESGSGMHCHQSLFKDGENIFYDENSENGLSQEAMWFIGGLLKHSAALTAVTNPIVNSYKRLVPGYEAPVYITYGIQNRSTLMDGIKNKIDPGEAVEINIYELSDEEREEKGIELLPSSLWEAYHTFEDSEIMKEALGDHIFNAFLAAKYEEWDEYRVQVFNYEHKKYLNL